MLVALAYVLFALGLYAMQRKMMYFPSNERVASR